MSAAMRETETKPTPDPTILTTEQLLREIGSSEKLTEARIKGVEDVTTEKFNGVKDQFALVERQRVEQKADAEKGIQAALSAAKEAVAEQTSASEKSITKSETATKEQINQMQTTFTTAIKGTDDNVATLSSRMDRFEAAKLGAVETRTDARAATSNATTIIAAVVGACVLLVLGYQAFRTHAATPPQIVTVTVPTTP